MIFDNSNNDIDGNSLVKDLINKLLKDGYGTLSKNDFYDYILYLLNKYSKSKFFDNNTNYENAVLLKVSETKIKNIKLNIALKFKEENEKNESFKIFLKKISDKKIKIVDNGNKFDFYIDDHFMRMKFENELKIIEGITFDYDLNKEKVSVEKSSFINVLKSISKLEENIFLEKFPDSLKNQEIFKGIKSKSIGFIKGIGDLAKDITTDILSEVIKKVFFNTSP